MRPKENLVIKINELKVKKIKEKKLVSLNEFRSLRTEVFSQTVLVVDEDESSRQGIKRILEAKGFQVLVPQNGFELAKQLETPTLEMIFLDQDISWVDAKDLCELLKSHQRLKFVPLALLSNGLNPDEDLKSTYRGVFHVFQKPVDAQELLDSLSAKLLA